MSRGDQKSFKQGDFTKAVEAMVLAGVSVKRVEIAHGRIMVGWDEVLQPGTPKDVVIQSWRGPVMISVSDAMA